MILFTRFAAVALAAVVTSYAAQPLSAQAETVPVPSGKPWQHDWTAMSFPPRIGDFEREEVYKFEDRDTNVSARYWDNDSKTILSLYIYRPGNPSTQIWFDRALIAIGISEDYGTVDLDRMKIGTFAPHGSGVASGQYAVLAVEGNFRSTAAALYRAGEWLVKVRISSQELSVASMDRLLMETLGKLPMLEGLDDRKARFVQSCDDTLQFASARAYEPDMAMSLAMATTVSVEQLASRDEPPAESGSSGSATASETASYCREGARNRQFNVYRPIGTDDRYTLALGDSGFSVDAYPENGAEALLGGDSDRSIYAVRSATGLQYALHMPFQGMPEPMAAAKSALDGPTIATINRPLAEDEDRTIDISVPGNTGGS